MSSKAKKITVLLEPEEFAEFDRFCLEHGFKKSTLLVRLLRDFLQREAIASDGPMPLFENLDSRQRGIKESSW